MISKNLNLRRLILVGWLRHQCNHSNLVQCPWVSINWIDAHVCVQLKHNISYHRFRMDSHVPRTISRGSGSESRIGFRNFPFATCLNNENDNSPKGLSVYKPHLPYPIPFYYPQYQLIIYTYQSYTVVENCSKSLIFTLRRKWAISLLCRYIFGAKIQIIQIVFKEANETF